MGGKKTEILHFDIGDGKSINLPVAVVTGDAEGPDAVVTAGIHGGEYGGYSPRYGFFASFPRLI